jgi:iron complex transport system permease protein
MMKEQRSGTDDTNLIFSNRGKLRVLGIAALLLIASGLMAMVAGAYDISIGQVLKAVLDMGAGEDGEALAAMIVWQIRLPRILLAIAVGVALAAAGAVFQACFRNPLVEPYILGVSAGSAFGAALGIVFPQFFLSIQLLAFLFGAVAVFSAYGLATVRGETPIVTLILAGVIIGSIGMALVSILKYISDDTALREIVFWYMGGFYYASWTDVTIILPVVLLGVLVLWRMGWKLNVLSMGEEESRSLGVHPERYKLFLVVIATLITALSVSAVGIIAWVGLMMPHAARALLGPDHRYMIPMAALMGAIYLIWCDTLARTMTSAEIPVGIITSITGAPYLIYLLRTKGKSIFGA